MKSDHTETTDFSVQNEGSLFLLRPITSDALAWIADHLSVDVMYFGNAVVVEHRYIADIVTGIQDDGLSVSTNE